MTESFVYTGAEPIRFDVFLADCASITRSQAKLLIDAAHATVGGESVKAGRLLKSGESVVLTQRPQEREILPEPENIPIRILYEDGYLAVVDKPRGMVVHPAAGARSGTLVNALLYRFGTGALSGVNEGLTRPGIVHRLDKDTTGVMLVAKTDKAHLSLARQIAEKTAERTYLALLDGALRDDTGQVVTQIGRDPRDRKKMAVLPSPQGKLAVTHYSVCERYKKYCLVKVLLSTGRTHQIRVHAKHLGHPVAGDPVYGIERAEFPLSGQMLHSAKIEFTHPVTGERLTFSASLPPDFAGAIEKLRPAELVYDNFADSFLMIKEDGLV